MIMEGMSFMKKCNECNVEMIDCKNKMVRSNLDISGMDASSLDLRYYNHNTKKILTPWDYVKARACPKCGKLELYVDPIKCKLNEATND